MSLFLPSPSKFSPQVMKKIPFFCEKLVAAKRRFDLILTIVGGAIISPIIILLSLLVRKKIGIGLRNMKQLTEVGFPLPVFDSKAGMLQVTFGRTKDFIADVKGVDSNKLSPEDKDGLLFIQKNQEVSVSDYATHLNLEIKTANRRLKKLVDKGLVIKIGEKKGTKYTLK
jgi:DNA-binding transcriptional ArsR family regulator